MSITTACAAGVCCACIVEQVSVGGGSSMGMWATAVAVDTGATVAVELLCCFTHALDTLKRALE